MMYSNAIKISGLNDYLTPGEECILPIKTTPNSYEIKLNDLSNIRSKMTSVDNSTKVTVGLSDCLSCSGCLTTSEELITRNDGYLEIMDKISKSDTCAVSISPQTVSIFASYYKLDPITTIRKLSYLFRKLGAKYVYDMSIGEGISLHECKMEYCRRFLEGCPENIRKKFDEGQYIPHNYKEMGFNKDTLPIITGHCPGWTLYAEKTQTNRIVDKISHISSSQQVQGLLIKTLIHIESYYTQLANLTYLHLYNGLRPINNNQIRNDFNIFSFIKMKYPGIVVPFKDIYHVSIAPCYDKKIESLRPQYNYNFKHFFSSLNDNPNNDYNIKLVDDCLSTGDIQHILNTLNIDFSTLPEHSLDHLYSLHTHMIYSKYFNYRNIGTNLAFKQSYNDINEDEYDNLDFSPYIRPSKLYTQSGGFAEEIFKYASKYLFGINVSEPKFIKTLNEDFMECTLKADDEILLRFVIANGYKNIQNIIQLLKQNDSISFIELMSCPGGCFNGAGQFIQKDINDYNVDTLYNSIKNSIVYKYIKDIIFPQNTKYNNNTRDITAPELTKESFNIYIRSSRYINTEDRIEVLRLTEFIIPRLYGLIDNNIIKTILKSLEDININTIKQLKW